MNLFVGFDRGAMERNSEAETIWATFAASLAVPFTYDTFKGRAYAYETDGVACASFIRDGHHDFRGTEYARIVLGNRFDAADPDERSLTLLHESIHLARSMGDLRPVDDVKAELCQRHDYNAAPARWAFRLADQILEADAEFFLKTRFPDRAGSRAKYYAAMQRGAAADRPWPQTVGDESRAAALLLLVLRLELAALLMDQDENARKEIDALRRQVEDEFDALKFPAKKRAALERVRELVSAARSDFDKIAEWAAKDYREAFTEVIDAHSGSSEENSDDEPSGGR